MMLPTGIPHAVTYIEDLAWETGGEKEKDDK